MPVVSTQTVVNSLSEVTIHNGGAVSVTISMLVPDMPPYPRTFEISKEEALPFWISLPTPDKNRWDDLCSLLYKILVDRGDLQGTIS